MTEATQVDRNVSNARQAGQRATLVVKRVEFAFRWIPAGSFIMGSSRREQKEAIANLKKYTGADDGFDVILGEVQHKVNITRGFWMLETPITQEMWKAVMGVNPSLLKSVFGMAKKCPVERVSFEACRNFAEKLNGLGLAPKGFNFSLPAEAEWEYACRAGTTTPYSFGNALNGDNANCDGRSPFGTDKQGPRPDRTTKVGKYPPNAWGLYDMHGNVNEWTLDFYGDYPDGEVTDPLGPEDGVGHVARGGCWGYAAVGCRAAARFMCDPDYPYFQGARLALRQR